MSSVDNEKFIWNKLINAGYSSVEVAGIMGNLFAESALKSTNLQHTFEKKLGLTDDEYTSKVDSGEYDNFINDSAGYGLAQWTYCSRKEALLKYMNNKKLSIGDLCGQVDFLIKELSSYKSVVAKLKAATSVREASDIMLLEYEKPANKGEAVKAKRASYGQTYYDKYASDKDNMFSSYLVRVIADALNVRDGAGKNYMVNCIIRDNGIYTIVDEKNGWGKLKSGAGWINLKYTKLYKGGGR